MRGDGDGWLQCGLGHRHWGKHGAAGLLLYTVVEGEARVLLQHRAPWCHQGDTWGIPGGARDSHESVVVAALREAHEEAEIDGTKVFVHREVVDDHHGWTYTTVIARSAVPLPTQPNEESLELVWQPPAATDTLTLHPGFGASWPELRARAVRVLVDTANVVGSRPDGWWRDRAAATTRQLRRLAPLKTRLVTLSGGHDGLVIGVTAVIEGKARDAERVAGVHTVSADGSGDDTLVDLAQQDESEHLVVVTSDRGLRARLPKRAEVVGPAWLATHLPDQAAAAPG